MTAPRLELVRRDEILQAAERQVLGALLLGGDVAGAPVPDDYSTTDHADIAHAIARVRDAGSDVSPLTVANRLGQLGRADMSVVDLIGLADDAMVRGGGATAAVDAQIVAEHADRRRFLAIAKRVVAAAEDGEDPAVLRARLAAAAAESGAVRTTTPIERAFAPLPQNMLSMVPEPRKWLLRHPDRNGVLVDDRQGDGLLPMGKVALLTSAGGVGKTMLFVELAVALITGRDWLGHFAVDANLTGDVLLALGEEDAGEVHRRLYNAAEALRLTEQERRDVERRLVVLSLAGIKCAVAKRANGDELQATGVVDGLLRKMQGRTWALAGLDPLSRFAGVSIDADNDAGTFVVTEFERLAIATGATVLVAHHSSKLARREGKADSRGASAIEDGVRWVASLRTDGERVHFWQSKSNYSRPMRETAAVPLVREIGGILRAEQANEKQASTEGFAAKEQAELEQHLALVVANLRRLGSATSIDEGCRGSGVRLIDARIAFRRGTTLGTIKNIGSGNRPKFIVSDDVRPPTGVGGGETPIPPSDVRDDVRAPEGRDVVRSPATYRTTRDDAGRRDDGTLEKEPTA